LVRARRSVVLLSSAIAAAAFLAPQALAGGKDAVYVQTNTAPVNWVLEFERKKDGSLNAPTRYATGGAGKPAGNPPGGIPFLDSAGSVTLSENGQLLFVVNAGDNTVTSFRVRSKGLEWADRESSRGLRPVSSTSHGKLLYVLNSETAISSISGYRVDPHGSLTPIAGSVRPTSQPAGGMPAQIQFDAKGDFLAVTEREAGAHGLLTTYEVDKQGVAGPPRAHASAGRTPFGVAFTNKNLMIVANEHVPPPALDSTVSAYDLTRDGDVVHRDTDPTNSGGACWTVITKDNKYAYVTSPFTGHVNGFRIGKDGSLTPVTPTSLVAQDTGLTLDEALSHDSRYLYVLVSSPPPALFAQSWVSAYEVNRDGTLTLIGKTAPFEGSASGAAAW
jgi:6-phosphogluconolactonase (cycloisomerase 2 family)